MTSPPPPVQPAERNVFLPHGRIGRVAYGVRWAIILAVYAVLGSVQHATTGSEPNALIKCLSYIPFAFLVITSIKRLHDMGYGAATPIRTNFNIYASVTNVVTLGAWTQTNVVFGVLTRQLGGLRIGSFRVIFDTEQAVGRLGLPPGSQPSFGMPLFGRDIPVPAGTPLRSGVVQPEFGLPGGSPEFFFPRSTTP